MWKLCKTYPPLMCKTLSLMASCVEYVQKLFTILVDKLNLAKIAELSTLGVDNLVENCAEVMGISSKGTIFRQRVLGPISCCLCALKGCIHARFLQYLLRMRADILACMAHLHQMCLQYFPAYLHKVAHRKALVA